MNHPLFAVGIPTLNRWDLLEPALLNYVKEFPDHEIFIYDNGNQGIPTEISGKAIHVMGGTGENIGVAGAWNVLCREIFVSCQYALILNDDIHLGKTGDFIEDFLSDNKHDLCITPLDLSVFILPKLTWELIGEFDEKFYPAYYEDTDYMYRMKLKGLRIVKTPHLIPAIHRDCMTSKADPDSFYDIGYKSKKYYKEKWGGVPGSEQYKKPFNK